MSISKDELLAKLAVKKGLMTLDQLTLCQREFEALDKDAKSDYSLLDIIINNGFATRIQLDNLDNSVEKSVLIELSSSPIEHQIIDGYEIKEKVGSGAMGVVYRAKHTAIGRDVALKILPPKLAKDDEYKERFLREARAAAKLNHQNIVCAYDVGMSNGLYYFAMEFVEGKSVMEMIREQGLFDEKIAVRIVKQIALALKLAWKQKIVHRDIKPENILVNKEGVAKLCDLGLAKQVDSDPNLTASGAAVGTPFYISPEQAKGQQEIDIRSDIYSLGATLFHMVIGRHPFEGTSAAVIMTKHINQPLPEPCVLRKTLSPKIGYIIKKMMQKTPETRYQNPTELLNDVTRFLEGLPLLQTKSTKLREHSPKTLRPTSTLHEPRLPMPEIHSPRIKRSQKTHAAQIRANKKNNRSMLVIVFSMIVLVAALTFFGYLATDDTESNPSIKPHTKSPEPSKTVRKIEKGEIKEIVNVEKTNSENELKKLEKKVLELLDTAEIKVKTMMFEEAHQLFDELISNTEYKEKLPLMIEQVKERKVKAFEYAEICAKEEIQRIEKVIKQNSFDKNAIAPFYNEMIKIWMSFNEKLKNTEEYKNNVIGEEGKLKHIHADAKKYFNKIEADVTDFISKKDFSSSIKTVEAGELRLPDDYRNLLRKQFERIEKAELEEKNRIAAINLKKQGNAPELYKIWSENLKKLISEMQINEALNQCQEHLNSDDYNLNEPIKKQLENDLTLLRLIQSTYDDIYVLLVQLGESGKTIQIDFDEFKNDVYYINIANLELQENTCALVPNKEIKFRYIRSENPQKQGKSEEFLFSTLPDNIFEVFLRYALSLSKKQLNKKYESLITFYILNLPEFPSPKDGEISDALNKIIKIFSIAKSKELSITLHPMITEIYKVRFETRARVDYLNIEKEYKQWDKKPKSKYKTTLAEELIAKINALLEYFVDSKVLTENNNENTENLKKWLVELQKKEVKDKDLQLFYGDYKLKGNKLEISYDFSKKEQLLDFTTGDSHENGVYGWDKTKKAMIISANPSYRREKRNISNIKWLPKFGDKEFDVKIEFEITHSLFFSMNLCKSELNKHYSIPLRARMRFWQNIIQIKHGLYSGKLDVMDTDKNKLLGDASEDMAPESGTLIYRIKRDRKGYITSYFNNKQVFKTKDESFVKGFMEFNAMFARFYIKRMEIECELDKDWLKTWEKTLKEDKDPRKDKSSSFWETDAEFKKLFDWDRDRHNR